MAKKLAAKGVATSPPRRVAWPFYPFRDDCEALCVVAKPRDRFSCPVDVVAGHDYDGPDLREIVREVVFDFYVPTDDELNEFKSMFPTQDPMKPRWDLVKAELIRAGIPVRELPTELPSILAMTTRLWSIPRPPGDWLIVLKHLGDEMSGDTFKRRRNDGTFRSHPNSTTRRVLIALADLPPGYRDSLNARSKSA